MEGISHETASLAGTLGLGKLIVLYDDNLISLDGPTELSFTENVTKRFEAYHWHVQSRRRRQRPRRHRRRHPRRQGRDHTPIAHPRPHHHRLRQPQGRHQQGLTAKPSAPKPSRPPRRTSAGPKTRPSTSPKRPRANWAQAKPRGKEFHAEWNAKFAEYKKAYPEPAAEFDRVVSAKLADGWEKKIPTFPTDKPIATRNAGQAVMNAIEKVVPELFGGAADLTASTKTIFKDSPSFHVDPTGRNVFFGVREFGMCAMVNGMAAHGGLIPFGSTFFIFSDYCRPAIRLAALMGVHSLFVFTHDSVGLGEDGPTHQPIEQLMSLRAIPHLTDFRPADANETAACWQLALERKSPSFMALSRQDLPVLDASSTRHRQAPRKAPTTALQRQGHHPHRHWLRGLHHLQGRRRAQSRRHQRNRQSRCPASRSSTSRTKATKPACCPKLRRRSPSKPAQPWAGTSTSATTAAVIGLDRFGASAPGPIALDKLGINVANVVEHAKKLVKK